MVTIQAFDLPEDVAEMYRRRAEASGQSLQEYVRDELIAIARRRDKADVMAIVRQTLARDPGPGMSTDEIIAALRELRGE